VVSNFLAFSSSALERERESNPTPVAFPHPVTGRQPPMTSRYLNLTSVDAFQHTQTGTFAFSQRPSNIVHQGSVSELAAGPEASLIFLWTLDALYKPTCSLAPQRRFHLWTQDAFRVAHELTPTTSVYTNLRTPRKRRGDRRGKSLPSMCFHLPQKRNSLTLCAKNF